MTTFPSSIFSFINVPEPRKVSAKFVYTFFTTDERSDDSGEGYEAGAFNDATVKLFEDRIPRYVKIEHMPVRLLNCKTSNEFIGPAAEDSTVNTTAVFSQDNLTKIQNEESFNSQAFSSVLFQDTGFDGKIFSLLSGSATLRGVSQSSIIDALKEINGLTDDTLDLESLVPGINEQTACGLFYHDEESGTAIEKPSFKELLELKFNMRFGNSFIGSVTRNIALDPYNLYSDEIAGILNDTEAIQKKSLRVGGSTTVDPLSWDTFFGGIFRKEITAEDAATLSATIKIAGYLVEKEELVGTTWKSRDSVIAKGNGIGTILDTKVKYGAVYRYQIRTVAIITMPARTANDRYALVTGLVASQASNKQVVSCVETTPPPPPGDFKPVWNYDDKELTLLWSFPTNKQQDIKYFQIFRRKSILKPYTLLAEYDFDDSEIKSTRSETIPDNSLFEMVGEPKTFYADSEFTKESTYIYTITCVDAHGYSSNYGSQFKVSFDKFKNRLSVKRISGPGAPKAYPNLYLEEDTFVDTLALSGYERINIYFDPEYLTVNDSDDNDLGLIDLDDPDARFKLQLINIDRQLDQVINITIKDLRSITSDKSVSSRLSRAQSLRSTNGLILSR